MKILQLIQKPQLRGAEVFAAQLSDHLLALGHDSKLVPVFQGEASIPFRGEIIPLDRPPGKRFWDWPGWKKFADLVEREKPDIIQANAGDTLKFAVFSKLFFRWNTPIVFRNASTISSYIKSPLVLWFNRFLFRKAAYVVSVSQHSMKDFLSLYPLMKNKIVNIPIGVTTEETVLPAQESGYLLHVGGFTFEKNHVGLLNIMKRLVQSDSSLRLWLIGDGPLRESAMRRVAELGLTSNVRFLGYQREVLPFIKSARMLLLPSIIEGLPGVILEAMMCRTPVVAHNVGGVSELVKPGETGWLVKAGDEEGFVKAVQEVLNNSGLDMVKENAYNAVVANYDNRVIAKRFLEVYQKISGS